MVVLGDTDLRLAVRADGLCRSHQPAVGNHDATVGDPRIPARRLHLICGRDDEAASPITGVDLPTRDDQLSKFRS